jgi:hypothetical protein
MISNVFSAAWEGKEETLVNESTDTLQAACIRSNRLGLFFFTSFIVTSTFSSVPTYSLSRSVNMATFPASSRLVVRGFSVMARDGLDGSVALLLDRVGSFWHVGRQRNAMMTMMTCSSFLF